MPKTNSAGRSERTAPRFVCTVQNSPFSLIGGGHGQRFSIPQCIKEMQINAKNASKRCIFSKSSDILYAAGPFCGGSREGPQGPFLRCSGGAFFPPSIRRDQLCVALSGGLKARFPQSAGVICRVSLRMGPRAEAMQHSTVSAPMVSRLYSSAYTQGFAMP